MLSFSVTLIVLASGSLWCVASPPENEKMEAFAVPGNRNILNFSFFTFLFVICLVNTLDG